MVSLPIPMLEIIIYIICDPSCLLKVNFLFSSTIQVYELFAKNQAFKTIFLGEFYGNKREKKFAFSFISAKIIVTEFASPTFYSFY